jgi:selenocysteine lyase/cysteine desulfurase
MGQVKPLVSRADFPALEEYVYLNSASISLMPLPALREMEGYERRILSAGTVSLDEEAEVQALDGAREGAARLLGVEPGTIAIASSCTEALCQLAWAIRPSGNIVSIDIEFPSVVYPWVRVAKETGAEVRLVRATDDPASLGLDAIAALVDDDTSVVCVSHVQYSTGLCLDLRALARLAHDHGALCIVDATQSAGVVPLPVADSGVDAVVATAYKWLCGPFGAAIFYLHPDLMKELEPALVGWRGTADMWHFDATSLTYGADMRRFEFSTMSYSAAYGLAQSLQYLETVSTEAVHQHGGDLTDQLIVGLDGLGAEILSPRERASRGSIVTARFPGRDGEQVAAELNRRGVVVSPRFGATRFSPHLFNNSADIDRALTACEQVLTQMPIVAKSR